MKRFLMGFRRSSFRSVVLASVIAVCVGAGWVYPMPSSAAEELVKLTASDGTAEDRFGISVSVSGDTAVVGAPHEDVEGREQQGAAYVFTLVEGSWVEQAKLVSSDGAAVDRFGTAVSVSGDTVVVGAFFADVGVSPDQGSAYVFTRTGGAWTEQAKLVASDGAAADNFGFFVDVSGDTALIGAYWDDVGVNVDQGSAYAFTRAGSTWTEQAKLTASHGAIRDEFGERVALKGDTAVVGSSEAAYVFTRAEGTWTEEAKLTASDGVAGDGFGSWVSISGNTLVVGAFFDEVGGNTQQGSAYVFTRSGGTWAEQAKLTASDGAVRDHFARSVTVSGDTVVVGAQGDDVGDQADQGSAYVFTRTGGTWTEQAHLISSDGTRGDLFGVSVAMSGGRALIGAGFAEVGDNAFQGAAYALNWTLTGDQSGTPPSPSAPTPSGSPTPPPPASEPTTVERSVEFALRGHLRSVGSVVAAEVSCSSDVPVVVQRKTSDAWFDIASTTTNADGAFAVRLPDRAGRYRAFAPEVGDQESTCLGARSAKVRHHH